MIKYPSRIRFLHWLTAALIILQIMLGFLMEDFLKLFYGHIILGASIILVTGFRIVMRLRTKIAPSRPQTISPLQWKAAKIGHFALYAFLIATPITGILAALNEDLFGDVHETLVYIFMALIIGHISMVMKHWYFDKENLLQRIT